MEKIKALITETLDSMSCMIEAHDGYASLGEIKNNTAVIYSGGRCSDCEAKCFEEAVLMAVPGIKVIVR